MALKLSELVDRHNFDLDTASLGRIRCGGLTWSMLEEARKALESGEVSGSIFARKLLQKIGQRIGEEQIENENNEKKNIKDLLLTGPDVDGFSDEEIENFSRKFIENNSWICKNDSNIENLRFDNEVHKETSAAHNGQMPSVEGVEGCDSDNLVMVFRHFFDEQTKRLNKFLGVTGIFGSPISAATENLLKGHFALSDRLKSDLRSIGTGIFDDVGMGAENLTKQTESGYKTPQVTEIMEGLPQRFDVSDIKMSEDLGHETNQRLDAVLNLAKEIHPIIVQSAQIIENMGNTMLRIQIDIGKSAQKSQIISIILAIVGVLSLGVTATYSWWSYRQSSLQEERYEKYLQKQQDRMDDLIEQQENRYREFFEFQNRQIKTLTERQNERFEKIIDSLPPANTVQVESDRDR